MARFHWDFPTCRGCVAGTAAQIAPIYGGRPKYRAKQAARIVRRDRVFAWRMRGKGSA